MQLKTYNKIIEDINQFNSLFAKESYFNKLHHLIHALTLFLIDIIPIIFVNNNLIGLSIRHFIRYFKLFKAFRNFLHSITHKKK